MTRHSNVPQEEIRSSGKSAVARPSMNFICRGTGGHTTAPSDRFLYTFGQRELIRALATGTAGVVVHHGPIVRSDRYVAAHSYFEGTTVFTYGAVGLDSLSLSDLKRVLAGQVNNWKQIGGNDLPVNVAMRGDSVFNEAARYNLLMRNVSVQCPTFPARSYEELVTFGRRTPGALLVGLRGLCARDSNLTEMKIAGRLPHGGDLKYPLASRVTALVRIHDVRAIDLAVAFASSLREQLSQDGHAESGDEALMHLGDQRVIEPVRKRDLVALLKTMKPPNEDFPEIG